MRTSIPKFKYDVLRVDNFKIFCTLAHLTICVLSIKHHMAVTKTTFLTCNLDIFYVFPFLLIRDHSFIFGKILRFLRVATMPWRS